MSITNANWTARMRAAVCASLVMVVVHVPHVRGETGICPRPLIATGEESVAVHREGGGDVTFKLLSVGQLRTISTTTIAQGDWLACRARGDSTLLFGGNGKEYPSDIFRIDRRSRRIIDHFWAYSPALSPDGRWLIMREMFPLHGNVLTEQYLLYDLEATPAANRGIRFSNPDEPYAGKLVFPVVSEEEAGRRIGLPASQMHAFPGPGFC